MQRHYALIDLDGDSHLFSLVYSPQYPLWPGDKRPDDISKHLLEVCQIPVGSEPVPDVTLLAQEAVERDMYYHGLPKGVMAHLFVQTADGRYEPVAPPVQR